MKLERLNRLQPDDAIDVLLSCCASRAWAEGVVARGPFESPEELYATAEAVWHRLPRVEWLLAFAAHPRIGERKAAAAQKGEGDAWSAQEQAGVWSAEQLMLGRLHELNQVYEQRFGHVFLIAAAGQSAEQILAQLQQRLENDPETELQIAAAEQAKITRTRLQRLIEAEA